MDHRLYDFAMAPLEARGLGATREQLLALATGHVLDVGGGTGANLAHYRPPVVDVVVAEPDHSMRGGLGRRSAAVPFTVCPQGVPGLPFDDASFDTIVCTLVLCTVADPQAALADLRRMLRPDGQLLFVEHVLARSRVGLVQRVVAPAWARVAGGCRLDRDTIAAMRSAGFVVTDCERPAPFGRLSAGMVVTGRAVHRQPLVSPAVSVDPAVSPAVSVDPAVSPAVDP